MPLPTLSPNADTRSIVERLARLIADFNGRRTAIPVASLPAEAGVGEVWMVNDANSTTFNSVAAGGGANVIGVRWDGTNWRIC